MVYVHDVPGSEMGPVNAKQSCPKNKSLWAMLKCMVSMATHYMIPKNWDSPTKSNVSMVLLILTKTLNLVPHLSLDTGLSPCDPICKSYNLHIHDY